METRQAIIRKINESGGMVFQRKPTTTINIGTPNTGVYSAIEFGDGIHHQTELNINVTDAFTTGDNASLADGYLIYTFPAGPLIVNSAYMSLALTATVEQKDDTPDIGLGTTIGTGVVATLDGTAGFENILTGATAADAEGTATVSTDICNSTAGTGGLIIQTGNPHIVHVNIADTWANDTSTDLSCDLVGSVVLNWTYIG